MSLFALVCLIASILAYSIYIGIICKKYQPSCISESYYLIENKGLFTFWIILVSFLIFPAWVEISPVNFQFLPFLSVVSLSSVGVNPRYLESQRTAHIVSAALAVIISLVWNIATGQYIIPILLGILLIILYSFRIKNLLFWTECTAFSNIYLSILFS